MLTSFRLRRFERTRPAAVLVLSSVIAFGVQAQTIERVRLTDNDLNCTQIYAEVQQMDTMIQLAASAPNAPAAPAAPVPAPAQVAQPAVPAFPAMAAPAADPNYVLQAAVLADPNVRASVARARAAGMSDAQIAATLGVGMQRAGIQPVPTPVSPAAMGAGQAYAQAGGLAGMLNAGMAGQGGGTAAAGFAGIFGALGRQASAAPVASPVQPAPVAQPVQQAVPQGVPPNAQAAGLGQQARARKEHLTGLFLSRNCKMSDVQK